MGIPTMFETAIVLSRRRDKTLVPGFEVFSERQSRSRFPFTEEHLDAAIDAFPAIRTRPPPPQIEFRDCMAYAVAAVAGMPLLYTGNDFAQTDIPARRRHWRRPPPKSKSRSAPASVERRTVASPPPPRRRL